jgi:haloacetate dehalogenase
MGAPLSHATAQKVGDNRVGMFDGFAEHKLEVQRGTIHARVGGTGPPLLLLHGYPQTHLMWHAAAPLLARHFTVVASDLAGYGASLRPAPATDHVPHSKRALAVDQVEAMQALGYGRFCVAGHDRGGRVAYRMALDHPDRVDALAVLDIVPTAEVWARADARLALVYWHWGFLAQPAPLPERLIAGDPDAYFEHHQRSIGLGGLPERYPDAVLDAYRAQLRDHGAVQAICEDYRAGASIDRALDEADRGRRIGCPVLALWGRRGALEPLYGDVLGVWRPWAADVRGRGIDASHFLVEDCPEQVAEELIAFFAEG